LSLRRPGSDGGDGGLDGGRRLRQGPRGRRRGELEGVGARGRPGAGAEGLGDAGAQRAERGLEDGKKGGVRRGIRVSFPPPYLLTTSLALSLSRRVECTLSPAPCSTQKRNQRAQASERV